MLEIRNTTGADLGGINALLVRAFSQVQVQEGQPTTTLPLCCEKFLHLYLQDTPKACFVATESHQVVAAVFGHCWGKFGWIGPLAVSPTYQGRGIGKHMLRKAVEALKNCGCLYIGLETHPANIKNINFYTRLGFIIGPLTVDIFVKKSSIGTQPSKKETSLEKTKTQTIPIDPPFNRLSYSHLDQAKRGQFLRDIEQLTAQIDSTIQVAHVIGNLSLLNYGETFLYHLGGDPMAFVILQTGAVSMGEKHTVGRILVLGLKQASIGHQLPWLLTDVLQAAKLDYLLFRVPALHLDMIHILLQYHFTIVSTHLRMYLPGYETPQRRTGLIITKWE